MGLSCGMKCLKFLLFAFNFIFWIAGIGTLVVGIWSRIKASDWDELIDNSTIPNAANLMIAAGAIVMLIGFLGCCGAIKENKCLLISYAISLILIFILEIAGGIYAYTKKNDVQKKLETGLTKAIQNSYGGEVKADEGLTRAVDWFQKNIKCCGSKDANDWKMSKWYLNYTKSDYEVPESCCIKKQTGCNNGTIAALQAAKKIHPKGCIEEGKRYVKKNMWQIGGVGVGIAFIQILGIVFAILLCRSVAYEKI